MSLKYHTVKVDIRPSRWRHPIARYRWWRVERTETKRRAQLTPEERQLEDDFRRAMDRAFLYGYDSERRS